MTSALSAQLGIFFDAGLKQQFRQTSEISEMEHQISMLLLQGQLAQVQRDLQLFQTTLANQTTPTSSFPGSPGSTQLTNAKLPGLGDAKEIATQVSNLVTTLAGRLDKASTAPRTTSGASSPLEIFGSSKIDKRIAGYFRVQ